jgi:hypothetical protein
VLLSTDNSSGHHKGVRAAAGTSTPEHKHQGSAETVAPAT